MKRDHLEVRPSGWHEFKGRQPIKAEESILIEKVFDSPALAIDVQRPCAARKYFLLVIQGKERTVMISFDKQLHMAGEAIKLCDQGGDGLVFKATFELCKGMVSISLMRLAVRLRGVEPGYRGFYRVAPEGCR